MTANTPLKRFRRFDESGQLAQEHSESSASPSVSFCSHCGTPLAATDRYYHQCGNSTATIFEIPTLPSASESVPPAAPYDPEKLQTPSFEKKPRVLPLVVGVLAVVFIIGVGLIIANGMSYSTNTGQASARNTLPSSGPIVVTLSGKVPSEPAVVNTNTDPTQVIVKPTVTLSGAVPATSVIATPTAALASCPGAPKQRLVVGKDARVCTQGDNVYLRERPGKSYTVIARVAPGTLVEVIGGPECSDNWSYWQVIIPDKIIGWMSEGGDRIDPYFLCPVY